MHPNRIFGNGRPIWQGLVASLFLLGMPGVALAQQDAPVSLRDSFPLGSGNGSLCQVQNRSSDPANVSMFDRSWAIVCRDSALPVGYVFALRESGGDPAARLAARRADTVDCSGATPQPSELAADSNQLACTWREGDVGYTVARADRGKTTYFAEGFSAYDSALSLALQSVISDRIVDGTVSVVSTSINGNVAFARLQAQTLEPDQALAEGYRRNNSGDYAAAAEYFETLQRRFAGAEDGNIDPVEFLINQALQKSNLGEFAEADALFEEGRRIGTESPVVQRLERNFEGIHLINQGQYAAAVQRLMQPVRVVTRSAAVLRENLEITTPISDRINASGSTSNLLGYVDDLKLTDEERVIIIDAQGKHLIATAQRLNGNLGQARQILGNALNEAVEVRDGRVVSIIRLRSQIIAELALVAEAEGNVGEAESLLRSAVDLLRSQYPETRALNASRARLAAFLARNGKVDAAQDIYRDVVTTALSQRESVAGISNSIGPYFRILSDRMGTNPALASDFLDAAQIMVRPGTAETQEILSRELSGGGGEASRLFRQSVNLSRSIERERIRFSALGEAEQTPEVLALQQNAADQLNQLEEAQRLTLVKLADYPQYKAVSDRAIGLEELQAALMPNEIFVKLTLVGPDIYTFLATRDGATGFKADLNARELDRLVNGIRDTISYYDGVQYVTTPFDLKAARAVYTGLFGAAGNSIAAAQHMIFEPDGAMLRLPPNLLVADDASVTAYETRMERIDADPFDVSGVNWLGRTTSVSTAVSARAFFEARDAPVSAAGKQYLGFGKNAVVFDDAQIATGVRGGSRSDATSCEWPLGEWNKPISDDELNRARSLLGGNATQVVTGEDFADDRILARQDLDDYRILHFATHGLVTPPRPECPARPSLLTSFGGQSSDGLLSFKEIFDLKLDADMVILSACDTAGRASVEATREAGLTVGGGSALDGLVRSFIGAGGRSVLASHWPAPDDFDATSRLISGLFEAPPGTSVAQSLETTQQMLMNDPITSHPYYWAGFAIIGDGMRPMISDAGRATLQTEPDKVALAK